MYLQEYSTIRSLSSTNRAYKMNSTISPAGTIDFYNSAPRSTNKGYKIKFSRLSPAVPVEYARGPTLVSTDILPKM